MMNELMKTYETFTSITPMVNDLSQEAFISLMCLLVDYHSAVHDADPVQVTATMHAMVEQVNDEMGAMVV